MYPMDGGPKSLKSGRKGAEVPPSDPDGEGTLTLETGGTGVPGPELLLLPVVAVVLLAVVGAGAMGL